MASINQLHLDHGKENAIVHVCLEHVSTTWRSVKSLSETCSKDCGFQNVTIEVDMNILRNPPSFIKRKIEELVNQSHLFITIKNSIYTLEFISKSF